jgi:hypothetical protein
VVVDERGVLLALVAEPPQHRELAGGEAPEIVRPEEQGARRELGRVDGAQDAVGDLRTMAAWSMPGSSMSST